MSYSKASKQASKPREVGGRGPGLRVCTAQHCAALPRTEPRHPRQRAEAHYSRSRLLPTASEINVMAHVLYETVLSVYFHPSSSKQSTMASVQDNLIVLPGSRKEGTSAEFPYAGTQYGAIVNYRRRVCARLVLNPERSVQPAAVLDQRAPEHLGRAGRQGTTEGTPGRVPARGL